MSQLYKLVEKNAKIREDIKAGKVGSEQLDQAENTLKTNERVMSAIADMMNDRPVRKNKALAKRKANEYLAFSAN